MNGPATLIRAVHTADFDQWLPLWEGYNAFYGRIGVTALDDAITRQTWERFFIESDPVQAFVAEIDGELVGLVHIVFHPSTSRKNDVCYLHDLFTSADVRGRGVGRALIERVYAEAQARACSRVYWTTYEDNQTARALYDRVTKYSGAIVYVKEL